MNVSAVILAGGRATRLNGVDKGLCLFQNKPLIRHVIEALEPQVSDMVISANRHLSEYEAFGYPVVDDGNNNFNGPLTGLAQALPKCQHNNVLVVSCDMPFIPTNLLELFDENANVSLQIISVENRMQLCFLMQKQLLASLLAYLKSGENRVMQWIKQQDYLEINYLKDARHFKNLNNPNDFLQ